jgi:DNA-binding CsgD family transcriptional regulator
VIDVPTEYPVARGPRDRSDPPVDVAGALRLQQHLHGAKSIPELLRRTSDAAQTAGGFRRTVVLTVSGDFLVADPLSPLDDPASDRLRRELLAAPALLAGATAESDFIRRSESGRSAPARGASRLVADYGFKHLALGAIMPEERVLALVAADSDCPVGAWGHLILQGVAHLATYALERIILRQRISEFREELRYMTVSATALIGECVDTPISMPTEHGGTPVFSLETAVRGSEASDLNDILTPREMAVAREVAAGRSNRAIAQSLHITEATAKKYVSRIMRKLGTTNRAETAVRCVRLRQTSDVN